MTTTAPIAAGDHGQYMRLALFEAKKASPKPTNFCVGAVLVEETTNRVLAAGYTMELPGNTHAEQCCLAKYYQQVDHQQNDNGLQLKRLVLYTTMEPCNKRASGNKPCTETILETQSSADGGIKTVYVGVKEPETFVGENVGRDRLEQAGIHYVHVPGFEDEILAVATAGHERSDTQI